MKDQQEYYSLRAPFYDEVYQRNDPERNAELARISDDLINLFKRRVVLEVAAGTGYWTKALAETAERVVATDSSQEMLELAEKRLIGFNNVTLKLADAYDLSEYAGLFSGAVANFWFSHIPKARIPSFLQEMHKTLKPDSIVFMADNQNVPGFGGEAVSGPTPEDGYKHRILPDGSEYTVVKNYYTRSELENLFSGFRNTLTIETGQYYWWLSYRILNPRWDKGKLI